MIYKPLYLKLLKELAALNENSSNFYRSFLTMFSLKFSLKNKTYIIPGNNPVKKRIDSFLTQNFRLSLNRLGTIIHEYTGTLFKEDIIRKAVKKSALDTLEINDVYKCRQQLNERLLTFQNDLPVYLNRSDDSFNLKKILIPNINVYFMVIYDLTIYLFYEYYKTDNVKKSYLVYHFWNKLFPLLLIKTQRLTDLTLPPHITHFFMDYKHTIPIEHLSTILKSAPDHLSRDNYSAALKTLQRSGCNTDRDFVSLMYKKDKDNKKILNAGISDEAKLNLFFLLYTTENRNNNHAWITNHSFYLVPYGSVHIPDFIPEQTYKQLIRAISAKRQNVIQEVYHKAPDGNYVRIRELSEEKKTTVKEILQTTKLQLRDKYVLSPAIGIIPEDLNHSFEKIIEEQTHTHEISYLLSVLKFCDIKQQIIPEEIKKDEFEKIILKNVNENEKKALHEVYKLDRSDPDNQVYYLNFTRIRGKKRILKNIFKNFEHHTNVDVTITRDYIYQKYRSTLSLFYDILCTVDTGGQHMFTICKKVRELGKKLFEQKRGINWIRRNYHEMFNMLYRNDKKFKQKWQSDFSHQERELITSGINLFHQYGFLVNFFTLPGLYQLERLQITYPLGYICGRKDSPGKRSKK